MKYNVLGMLKAGGFQKDLNDFQSGVGTPYLLSRQREPYRVEVKAGLLVQMQNGGLHPFDTTSSSNDTYIFVMSGDGEIYSGDKREVMHHSSFLAGREVAAAGSWIVRSGRLNLITNLSGHYQLPTDYAEQVLRELKSRGVNISNVRKSWTGGDSAKTAKAMKELGHKRERQGDHGFKPAEF